MLDSLYYQGRKNSADRTGQPPTKADLLQDLEDGYDADRIVMWAVFAVSGEWNNDGETDRYITELMSVKIAEIDWANGHAPGLLFPWSILEADFSEVLGMGFVAQKPPVPPSQLGQFFANSAKTGGIVEAGKDGPIKFKFAGEHTPTEKPAPGPLQRKLQRKPEEATYGRNEAQI